MGFVELQRDLLTSIIGFLRQHPQYFPVLFIFAWLFITTSLGFLSGWYRLMTRFPNRVEGPHGVVHHLSGRLGIVRMTNLLRLEVCPSGLRFGMFRLFGIFCRDFFVPWQNMSMQQTTFLGIRRVQLQFRSSSLFVDGMLTMSPEQISKIASLAKDVAPEGMFPAPEANGNFGRRLLLFWLLGTTLAGLFFNLAPRLMFYWIPMPPGTRSVPVAPMLPPWYVLFIFPGVALGLASLVQYIRFRRSDPNP